MPERESVAAMAEKADMIGVSGLKEAALLLANRDTRCGVFITAVQLRQAPALLELLTNAKRMPPGWVIPRDKKLRQLSRLANELSIVEEVVLPLLMEDAADVDGVRLLHQYGWSIRHIARHVDKTGGPFFLAAAEASSFVLSLQGHLKSRTRSVEFLRKNLEDLRVKIGEFKQFTVHLPAEVGVEEDGVDGRLVAGEDEEGHQV